MNLVFKIPVRLSVYDAKEPYKLMDELGRIGGILLEYGLYEPSELPAVIRQAEIVYDYVNQVCNGGHGTYFSNKEGDRHLFHEVAAALRDLGMGEVSRMLDDALQDRQNLDRDGRWQPSRNFDREFYALNANNGIYWQVNRGLKSDPTLFPVDNVQWKFDMQDVISANPHRVARATAKGASLRDFARDLSADPPPKKSPRYYAEKLAEKHGYSMSLIPKYHRVEDHPDERLSLYGYECDKGRFMIIYRNLDEALLFAVDEKLELIWPPLDTIKIEKEVV